MNNIFPKLLYSLLILSYSFALTGAEDGEIITTIILINRNAELVDINFQGEVVKRHVGVPDYFTSRKSHQTHLINSLKQLGDIGYKDHFLPNISTRPNSCLQGFMLLAASSHKCNYKNSLKLSIVHERGASIHNDEISEVKIAHQTYGQLCFINSLKRQKFLEYPSSAFMPTGVIEALNESLTKYREPLRRRIV